ncbi:MAG: serine/threonine protein kinase, partial [bacterium]|nr:serine/threonine protein kinase [bacterium]
HIMALLLFAILSNVVIGLVRKHLKLIAFWKKKKHFASYEIEKQIGVGGMGIVHKVHSLMDKSKVFAMKVMKEEHLVDETQKKRFKNESLLVDRIDHPNLVKVYERGEDNGRLYIVMELLEGFNLAERYKKDKYPNVSQCIHILTQITDILVNLHAENIIHRDLKPENIMLIEKEGDPDFVKLLDFGLAKVQSFSHLTESGQVVGTLPYMPPEIFSDGAYSPAIDIYSLGIIGYEMLTRKKPFSGKKPIDTIKMILDHTPPEPAALLPEIPPHLNSLLLKMIEKAPTDR